MPLRGFFIIINSVIIIKTIFHLVFAHQINFDRRFLCLYVSQNYNRSMFSLICLLNIAYTFYVDQSENKERLRISFALISALSASVCVEICYFTVTFVLLAEFLKCQEQ